MSSVPTGSSCVRVVELDISGVKTDVAIPVPMLVGYGVAPVIEVAKGGDRKVKYVIFFVEALGSSAQRVIVTARSEHGHGRLAKGGGGGVVDTGEKEVNESLTNLNI
ncbi:hypothetical protein V6N13_126180 [Hibiscus sabdariffa]|uniref:Uncharacterized protein n=2 Tax=Hibiscus sabdariffa TaxID=183260 RepID=A0ABR2ANT6_9ROSI